MPVTAVPLSIPVHLTAFLFRRFQQLTFQLVPLLGRGGLFETNLSLLVKDDVSRNTKGTIITEGIIT